MRYSSSQICQIANVTKKTLRHYHKIDLLSPSQIDSNGYWYYGKSELDTLQIIKNLQVIGYNLKEIKANMDSDCSELCETIPEKLQYIDEQMLQLQLTKNLLTKIKNKENISPLEALKLSMEEEHMEWYEKNLSKNQYLLLLAMMEKPESMTIHDKIINSLRSCKPLIKNKNIDSLKKVLDDIRALFVAYDLTSKTSDILLNTFITSNLEGPLSQRVLSINEAVYLLSLLDCQITIDFE